MCEIRHVEHNDTGSIIKAATALSRCLEGLKYALVGGAACVILGSVIMTDDIDVVLIKGTTLQARRLLRADSSFRVEKGTLHTTYHVPGQTEIDIDLLAPPMMWRKPFDESTPVIDIGGIKVLLPLLLLDAKCGSYMTRAILAKKNSDAEDIEFLLYWHIERDIKIAPADVPAMTSDFWEDVNAAHPSWAALWLRASS